ncbi:hypothetical protein MRX96_027364 [Rhipicephalus microplus]
MQQPPTRRVLEWCPARCPRQSVKPGPIPPRRRVEEASLRRVAEADAAKPLCVHGTRPSRFKGKAHRRRLAAEPQR